MPSKGWASQALNYNQYNDDAALISVASAILAVALEGMSVEDSTVSRTHIYMCLAD